MPSASSLDMIDLDDTSAPITCRYNLATTWGVSSQEITLDVPALSEDQDHAITFFKRVWSDFIATAISHQCTLSFLELVFWKGFAFPLLGITNAPAGQRPAAGSPRNASGLIMLHSGHADRYSRRRFWLPNMPVTWQDDRVLNGTGQTGLYGLCASLFMGANLPELDGEMSWLMAFPHAVDVTPSNLGGVGFRRVRSLRIVSYCDEAPDQVPIDWP